MMMIQRNLWGFCIGYSKILLDIDNNNFYHHSDDDTTKSIVFVCVLVTLKYCLTLTRTIFTIRVMMILRNL